MPEPLAAVLTIAGIMICAQIVTNVLRSAYAKHRAARKERGQEP